MHSLCYPVQCCSHLWWTKIVDGRTVDLLRAVLGLHDVAPTIVLAIQIAFSTCWSQGNSRTVSKGPLCSESPERHRPDASSQAAPISASSGPGTRQSEDAGTRVAQGPPSDQRAWAGLPRTPMEDSYTSSGGTQVRPTSCCLDLISILWVVF